MDGAEWVVVFSKVLGKLCCKAIGPECVFVFVKPYCEAPSRFDPHMLCYIWGM